MKWRPHCSTSNCLHHHPTPGSAPSRPPPHQGSHLVAGCCGAENACAAGSHCHQQPCLFTAVTQVRLNTSSLTHRPTLPVLPRHLSPECPFTCAPALQRVMLHHRARVLGGRCPGSEPGCTHNRGTAQQAPQPPRLWFLKKERRASTSKAIHSFNKH